MVFPYFQQLFWQKVQAVSEKNIICEGYCKEENQTLLHQAKTRSLTGLNYKTRDLGWILGKSLGIGKHYQGDKGC